MKMKILRTAVLGSNFTGSYDMKKDCKKLRAIFPFFPFLKSFLLKQSLKTQKKPKELEIINQNAIYICISWYSKVCWFLVRKCWCQQNARGASRDSYSFCIFFRQGITVPSFAIAGFVWEIWGRRPFCPPHPPTSVSSPEKVYPEQG